MASAHDEPATKGDLTKLTGEMAAMETRLTGEMAAMETRLTGEIGRAVGVAMEQVGSQMRAVLREGVENRFESLERRMTDLEKRLTDSVGMLERVIQENSTELHAEIASLRAAIERRDERLDLERRMTVVEERLGIRK